MLPLEKQLNAKDVLESAPFDVGPLRGELGAKDVLESVPFDVGPLRQAADKRLWREVEKELGKALGLNMHDSLQVLRMVLKVENHRDEDSLQSSRPCRLTDSTWLHIYNFCCDSSLAELCAVSCWPHYTLLYQPCTWQGKIIDFVSPESVFQHSKQLIVLLKKNRVRWQQVVGCKMPRVPISQPLLESLGSCLPRIHHLDLSNMCHDQYVTWIKLSNQFPFLQVLKLPFCAEIGVSGLRLLCTLPLRHLSMPGNMRIHCKTPCAFMELGNLHQLEWLNISAPPWGREDQVTNDRCLESLAALPSLEHLDISNMCTITNAGLQIVSTFPALKVLVMWAMGRGVNGAGLDCLSGCEQLDRLDMLECQSLTQVEPHDIDRFRASRPDVHLSFN